MLTGHSHLQARQPWADEATARSYGGQMEWNLSQNILFFFFFEKLMHFFLQWELGHLNLQMGRRLALA